MLKNIEAIAHVRRTIDLPVNLGEFGLASSNEQIMAMAKVCFHVCGGTDGGATQLKLKDMGSIYLIARDNR